MKKVIVFALMLLMNAAYAQKENPWSVGARLITEYCYNPEYITLARPSVEYDNSWDYGFGVSLAKQVWRLKVETGANMLFNSVEKSESGIKNEAKYALVSIPLLLNVKVLEVKGIALGVVGGFNFDMRTKKHYEVSSSLGSVVYEGSDISSKGVVSSYELGLTFSKDLGSKLRLNLCPYIRNVIGGNNSDDPENKVIIDGVGGTANQRTIPNVLPSYNNMGGIKIGIEYMF